MRSLLFATVLGAILCPFGQLPAFGIDEIISETAAERHGLARPWITQVQVDRARGRVRDIVLYDGTLYVQTTRAMMQAIDAETGRTLWAKQVGRPEHPSLTPGVYRDLVSTINGSRLYVMNRYTGEVLFETQTNGAPGAGPGISAKRAYVPMVTGMVLAYRIEPVTDPMKELGKFNKKELTEEEKKAEEEERRQNIRIHQEYVPPLACQSVGRALVQPLVTLQNRDEELVVWGTDRGYLNVGRVDRRAEDAFIVKFRLRTGDAITAQSSYLPPDPTVLGDTGTIFTTSRDGFVYATLERGGDLLWKFSVAEPVVESATLIEDRLYVPTQSGGLYCLDAKNGKQLWWAADIMRFLAASKQRVYAADKVGRVRILDIKSGSQLDVLPTEILPVKVTNNQTDRLYLGTETGLLQCLHELELTAPIHFGESRKPSADEEMAKPPVLRPKAKPGADEGVAKEKPARPKPAAKEHAPAKSKSSGKKAKSDDGLGFDDAPAAKEKDDAPAAKEDGAAGGMDDQPAPKGKAAKGAKARAPREKAAPRQRSNRGRKGKGADDGGGGDNPLAPQGRRRWWRRWWRCKSVRRIESRGIPQPFTSPCPGRCAYSSKKVGSTAGISSVKHAPCPSEL